MMWTALAICIAVVAAFLFLPFGIEIASGEGERRWFAILAGVHVPVPKRLTRAVWRRFAGKGRSVQNKKPAHGWMDLTSKIRRILSRQESLSDAIRLEDLKLAFDLVVRLMHVLRIRVHRLNVMIASPDPAWTGMAYGWACAAVSILPAEWPVAVDVDWDADVPGVVYRVEATAIPAHVILALFRSLGKRFMPVFLRPLFDHS